LFKRKEQKQGKKIFKLCEMIEGQEKQILDLAQFAQWEETAHEQFTYGLRQEGLEVEDIAKDLTA
jgi:hypothetical protein